MLPEFGPCELVKDYARLVKDYARLVKDYAGLVKDYAGLVKDYAGLVKDYARLVKDYAGSGERSQYRRSNAVRNPVCAVRSRRFSAKRLKPPLRTVTLKPNI